MSKRSIPASQRASSSSDFLTFAFGGFLARARCLPRYLVSVYDFRMEIAGTVAYSIRGSTFRANGDVPSDEIGTRKTSFPRRDCQPPAYCPAPLVPGFFINWPGALKGKRCLALRYAA